MTALRNLLLAGMALASLSVLAGETVTKTITLKATYLPPTCTVTGNGGESEVSVDFGVLARDPGSWGRQPIPVKLSCDENIKSVSATIIGDSSESGNLLAQGVGDSVEIGIFTGPVQLEVSKPFKVDHHQPLQLEAKPIATGKTIPSEGGAFTAKATLRVNYE